MERQQRVLPRLQSWLLLQRSKDGLAPSHSSTDQHPCSPPARRVVRIPTKQERQRVNAGLAFLLFQGETRAQGTEACPGLLSSPQLNWDWDLDLVSNKYFMGPCVIPAPSALLQPPTPFSFGFSCSCPYSCSNFHCKHSHARKFLLILYKSVYFVICPK